jgi:RNA polymerase-binding transcription factor DksA
VESFHLPHRSERGEKTKKVTKMQTKQKKQKKRYSDGDLAEFKKNISNKLKHAEKYLDHYKSAYMNNKDNGTNDTSPVFKSFEEGSETMTKESNAQLALRQEKFITDLKNALIRIENKNYGICRITGNLIPKARLKLVPHATLSIEGKNLQEQRRMNHMYPMGA